VAAGLFVKLYSDVATEGLPDRLVPNLWSSRMLVAVGAGLATGVYSYLTIYADDPTFVARFSDVWRVTAETFAGTLAGKALTDLAKPPKRKDPGSGTAGGDGGGTGERAVTPAARPAAVTAPANGSGGAARVVGATERRTSALDAVATMLALPRFFRDVRRPPAR